MSAFRRYASLRRLQVVLGLGLMGLMALPGVAPAAQMDTVSASGTAEIAPGQGLPTPAEYTNVTINAQSGTSGQNPSGNASLTLVASGIPGSLTLSGPVTCLHVQGPDAGAGTSGSPTTAVLTFQNTTGTFSFISVTLIDNGGNGADTISSQPAAIGTDCSQPFTGTTGTFTNGRAVVFDAAVLPTSKEQCKNGGWQSFGVFKNQGDCVSFVATHGKNPPG